MKGGKQERMVQDRSRGSGKEGRRKGGMKEIRDEEKERFRTRGVREREGN